MNRVNQATRRLAHYLMTARPWPLLGALCVLQVLIAAGVALTSMHNHFLWYSGGDATEYWTNSWALAHGMIPQAHVSFAIPVLYAWVPLVTGATLLSGLPVIVLIQLLVFVPLAAILVWAIADLLFGRMFAWWALLLWIAGPLLLLWGFSPSFAPEFRDLFVAPHWYGLTNMADMPSLVAVLAAAWATLRLFERRAVEDALLSGLLVGVAIGIKPANGFFLPAVAVLALSTRNSRAIVAWGAACAPSLVTLALWKDKGLGNLPLLAYSQAREALGSPPAVAAVSSYLNFDLTHLEGELRDLGNVFWSLRLLEFLVIAGFLGALRRSPIKSIFLALWFAAFCIVKGSSTLAGVTSLSYFRFVEPGLPAYALLAASVVYLFPRGARVSTASLRPGPIRGGARTLGAAFVVLALVPLALILVIPRASTIRYVWDPSRGNNAPISDRIAPAATASGGVVQLAWPSAATGSTESYYLVYRSSGPSCAAPSVGARECDLEMTAIENVRGTSYVDHPPPGRHWYRIGLAANYSDALDGSDLMLLSPAVEVTTTR